MQLACSQATWPAPVRSQTKPLSSTGMSQKNVADARRVDLAEVAEEPARQVDQMHALVEQLAAAGDGGIGPPFAVVAEPAAVPYAARTSSQRPDGALIDELRAPSDRRVEAVVEADLDDAPPCGAASMTAARLGGVAGRRLLDEDVLARLDGGERHGRRASRSSSRR